MKPIVFVGSNGNLLQMVDNAHSTGRTVAGIVDSDYYNNTNELSGVPVIGSEDTFEFSDNYDYFLASSWFPENTDVQKRNYNKRKKLISILEDHNIQCINLVHSLALVPDTVTLGNGIMIGAGAILGNQTTVDDFAQIREQSYLAHHAHIGNSSIVQVKCYVGSCVHLGNDSYMGIRSSVVPAQAEPISIPVGSFIKSHCLVTSSNDKNINKVKHYGI